MTKIMFIRHGEKSKHDDVNLSATGFWRAYSYIHYFISNKNYTPDIIYAFKQKDHSNSNRPLETILPLYAFLTKDDAKACKLNNEYYRDDVSELVKDIEKSVKDGYHNILVCWEHDVIPEIINKFGFKNVKSYSATPTEKIKNDDIFNVMIIIENGSINTVKTVDIGQCHDYNCETIFN